MFDKEQLLTLRRKVDLREIVAETLVPVTSTGKKWKFHCPFHEDGKNPNFFVYADGYHCFSAICGANGTIYDWLMYSRHITFREAVHYVEQVGNETVTQSVSRDILTSNEYTCLGLSMDLKKIEGTDLWRKTLWERIALLSTRLHRLLQPTINQDVQSEARNYLKEIELIGSKITK